MGQGSVKSLGCASNILKLNRTWKPTVFGPARMQRSKCNFDCPLIRALQPSLPDHEYRLKGNRSSPSFVKFFQ